MLIGDLADLRVTRELLPSSTVYIHCSKPPQVVHGRCTTRRGFPLESECLYAHCFMRCLSISSPTVRSGPGKGYASAIFLDPADDALICILEKTCNLLSCELILCSKDHLQVNGQGLKLHKLADCLVKAGKRLSRFSLMQMSDVLEPPMTSQTGLPCRKMFCFIMLLSKVMKSDLRASISI